MTAAEVDIAEPPKRWERQVRESDEAWEAFRTFLHLGPGRTCVATAEAIGKSETMVYRWSGKWDWRSRVQAWESEQDTAWQQRILNERRLIGETHVDIARELRATALAGLRRLDLDDLKPMELLEFVKAAVAIEGRIFQVGTDNDERAHGVRIILDPRLLPPGAELPATD